MDEISRGLIENGDLHPSYTDREKTGWLGLPGASEDAILSAERRLKVTLPPSYKSFLRCSNGFLQVSTFIWDLLPVEGIDWLRNHDPDFVALYSNYTNEFQVDDSVYYIYGEGQETVNFRAEYLQKCIAVSGWGDAAIVLLNPEIKFGDEMEAWIFANWYPGAARYKSFLELITAELETYKDIRKGS